METYILTIVFSLIPVLLTSIIGFLIRISRQLTRIVQHFDSDSEVSKAMGGTLPERVQEHSVAISELVTKVGPG